MKIADLLNEHGLKWFKFSNIFFGFLWGIFGVLVVFYGNMVISSAMLAMNIAFLVRNRLDYLNHQIASSIIIIGGISFGKILIPEFLIFYLIFLVFGFLKDYVDDVLHWTGLFSKINELMLYYPIPTFFYSLFYGNWSLFFVFTTYTIFYDLTKYFARKKGYI